MVSKQFGPLLYVHCKEAKSHIMLAAVSIISSVGSILGRIGFGAGGSGFIA